MEGRGRGRGCPGRWVSRCLTKKKRGNIKRKSGNSFIGRVFSLISLGSQHVRPIGRTYGGPDEIELSTLLPPVPVWKRGTHYTHYTHYTHPTNFTYSTHSTHSTHFAHFTNFTHFPKLPPADYRRQLPVGRLSGRIGSPIGKNAPRLFQRTPLRLASRGGLG